MATKTRRHSARNVRTAVDAETYQVGTWSGFPNFGCPFNCGFFTLGAGDLDGTAVVVAHIAEVHREQAIAQAQEAL